MKALGMLSYKVTLSSKVNKISQPLERRTILCIAYFQISGNLMSVFVNIYHDCYLIPYQYVNLFTLKSKNEMERLWLGSNNWGEAWEREEEAACGKGNGDRTGNVPSLVFMTTCGMADKYVKYQSRLEELIANKKRESYLSAISWIRAKVSFAMVRSAIQCLRGSRSRRRQLDFVDSDLQIDNIRACPN